MTVASGFGYGCVGADIHVFGNGSPLYILENWRPPGQGDPRWLLELPSRMLSPRYSVVGFTGREEELGSLRNWRDRGSRLSVRWLHAPGGQGKTRLAAQFARESRDAGWKAVSAVLGPGTVLPPPGSQDLRADQAPGLLLIVDYADRWPVSRLSWLLSNTMLHDPARRVRVLFLARGLDTWPAVRDALASVEAGTSAQYLGGLGSGGDQPGVRLRMFTAARDSFADRYGIPAEPIEPPGTLNEPDFGLTLAVHMAALAAVDHRARGSSRAFPDDMTGLTAYLLDRERRHWHAVHHGDGNTAPVPGETSWRVTLLARVAFVAALTGPLENRDARAALTAAGIGTDAERALADHQYCYPPDDPRTFLEPLYPDRLAEDFIALSMPGHGSPDHASDAWAHDVPGLLLSSPGEGLLPPYAARVIAFLCAASERWPHLIATLEAIESLLPAKADQTLAVAAADLTERLSRHRLPVTTDPADRARIYDSLGTRFQQAFQYEKSSAAYAEAVPLYRQLASTDPERFEPKLASSARSRIDIFQGLAMDFPGAVLPSSPATRIQPIPGEPVEVKTAFREAIQIFRELAQKSPEDYSADLSRILTSAGLIMHSLGEHQYAVDCAMESVKIANDLLDRDITRYAHLPPRAIAVLAGSIAEYGPADAVKAIHQSIEFARKLTETGHPNADELLTDALIFQSALLLRLGRARESITPLREVMGIGYIRAEDGSHGDPARTAITRFALRLALLQDSQDGHVTACGTAVEMLGICAREAWLDRQHIYMIFLELIRTLGKMGQWNAALTVHRGLTEVVQSSSEPPPGDNEADLINTLLTGGLSDIGILLMSLERWEEALIFLEESARMTDQLNSHYDQDGSATGVLGFSATMMACRSNSTTHDSWTSHASATLNEIYSGNIDDKDVGRGEREEAVRVLYKFAETYRAMIQEEPSAHEPYLAATLKVLSDSLWHIDRRDEAIAIGQEAVALRRQLSADGDPGRLTHLALALKRIAHKKGAVKSHAEAAEAALEAASIRRGLAEVDPGEHEIALAAALHTAAVNLRMTDPETALGLARESVALLVKIAENDPDAYQPELATARRTIAMIEGSLPEPTADQPGEESPPDGAVQPKFPLNLWINSTKRAI